MALGDKFLHQGFVFNHFGFSKKVNPANMLDKQLHFVLQIIKFYLQFFFFSIFFLIEIVVPFYLNQGLECGM